MVKREKSPEITEDIRLYVVWIPYPLNANWVYEEDLKECAHWVAHVIGSGDHLINIHQKPSSRGMILLEISKEFTEHKWLLGEHQWSRFLKNPTTEEIGRKTCVYYSIYSTCRDAWKDGWRPLPIPTKWFEDWYPGKSRIVTPYPQTTFCYLPPEDKTGKPICRNLPVEIKPPPPRTNTVAPPVVGSSAWVEKQGKEKLGPESLNNSWRNQNKRSADVANEIPAIASPVISSTRNPTSSRQPDSDQAPRTMMKLPKSKPVPLHRFASENQTPKVKNQAAWMSRSQSLSTGVTNKKSPLLEQPSEKPQNAWANRLKVVPEKPPKVLSSQERATGWEPTNGSWFDMVEDEGDFGQSDTTPIEDLSPSAVHPAFGNSQAFGMDQVHFPQSDDEEDDLQMEEILAPLGNFSITHGKNSGNASNHDDSTPPAPVKSGEWGTEWNEEKKAAPEISCPSHGRACSKKICKDYQRLYHASQKLQKKKNAEEKSNWRTRGRRNSKESRDSETKASVAGRSE